MRERNEEIFVVFTTFIHNIHFVQHIFGIRIYFPKLTN